MLSRNLFFLVLALALGLRVAYLLIYIQEIPHYQTPLVDAKIYAQWASAIFHGDFFSRGEGVFYRAPLYPYLLAGFLSLFGRLMPWVAILQIGLGLGTILLVAVMARRLAGDWAALFSALLLVLYGPAIAAETKLLGTSLGLFLHALTLYSVIRFAEVPSTRRGFGSGLLLGLTALVRPLSILLALILPLVLIDRPIRAKWKSWVLRWVPFGIGLLVIVAPVTIRNRVIGGDWVPIAANGGMTFFQGNNVENRSGLLTVIQKFQLSRSAERQREVETRVASDLSGRELRPSEISRFWAREGFRFISERPAAWLRLEGMKFYRFVTSFEYADNYSYYAERRILWPLRVMIVPFGLLLSLGLLGMLLLRGRASGPTLSVAVVSVALGIFGCLAFYVSSRYRMESVPALAVLGGAALAQLAHRKADRGRRFPIAIGFAGLVFLASFLPAGMPARSQESISYLHLGNAYEKQGRVRESRDAYRTAAELLPGNPFAWRSYLKMESQVSGMDAAYRRLEEIPPEIREHAQIQYSRGFMAAALGRADEAVIALRAAVEQQPLMGEAHGRLGALLVSEGRYEEAEPYLVEALRLKGREPELLSHLGYIRIQSRNYSAAVSIYQETLQLRPDDLDALLNLGAASYYAGRLEVAEDAIDRLIAIESAAPTGPDPMGLYYRGLIRLRHGDFEEAVSDLGPVVTAWPGDPRALYYRDLARAGSRAFPAGDVWVERWAAQYGPSVAEPESAALLRTWLRLRADSEWGAPLRPPELDVWQRLQAKPDLSPLVSRISKILAEEGVNPVAAPY